MQKRNYKHNCLIRSCWKYDECKCHRTLSISFCLAKISATQVVIYTRSNRSQSFGINYHHTHSNKFKTIPLYLENIISLNIINVFFLLEVIFFGLSLYDIRISICFLCWKLPYNDLMVMVFLKQYVETLMTPNYELSLSLTSHHKTS